MPNISVLKSSKFLKKEDCDPPVLVTIKDCTELNVAQEGAPEEFKWCLHFEETDKPMVLNSTNGQLIAKFIGKDNTEEWVGHKIVLYHDPNVSFGGKLIGGIRARAPKVKTPPSVQTAPVKAQALPAEGDDEVPF